MFSRDFSKMASMVVMLIPLLSARMASTCLVVSFHFFFISGLTNDNNNNWLVGEPTRLTVAISSGMLFNTKPSSSCSYGEDDDWLGFFTKPEEARLDSCSSIHVLLSLQVLTSVVGVKLNMVTCPDSGWVQS